MPDPEGLAGADQAEILLRAAQMAHLAALGGRCVALRREAIAVVGEGAGPVRLAVMHEALGRALWANGELRTQSLAEYELAVAAMPAEPPTAERARVLSGYGQMLMLLDRWQESAALCEEAIAIAQLVGAREAEGHARTPSVSTSPPRDDARRRSRPSSSPSRSPARWATSTTSAGPT